MPEQKTPKSINPEHKTKKEQGCHHKFKKHCLKYQLDLKELNSLKIIHKKKQDTTSCVFSVSKVQWSNKDCKNLVQKLKPLYSLKSLAIQFTHCQGITPIIMRKLARGLKGFKLLHSISFRFKSCYDCPSDEGSQNLMEELVYLKSLKSLCFCIEEEDNYYIEKGLIGFTEGLKHLSRLKSLKLSISNYIEETKNLGLKALGQGIKTLSLLEDLSLEFCNWDLNEMQGLTDLAKGFINLSFLKSLTLNIKRFNITDKVLGELSEEIKHFKGLQNLSLSFSKCQRITSIGLSSLSSIMKDFASLKRIFLDFGYTKVGDTGIIDLSEGLKHLSSLKNIQLVFTSCEVTGEALAYLVQALRLLSLLESIKINFDSCNDITYKEVKQLQSELSELEFLQEMNVSYYSSFTPKPAFPTFL